jgi:hypothetical protein
MLYLLNTTVIPCGADGIWQSSTLPLESAKLNIRDNRGVTTEWISAIGHESTAAVMSELLKVKVPVNRIQVQPAPGDKLLCFKLKGRAPEGVVLNQKQIEEMGYEWALMTYHGSIGAALDAQFKAQGNWLSALNQRVY